MLHVCWLTHVAVLAAHFSIHTLVPWQPSPGFRASQSLVEGSEEDEPEPQTGTPRGEWLEEHLFKG